jgi:hypothetical protein
MPFQEREPREPNNSEELYELEKGFRLMPDDLRAGGMYSLRLKLLTGEAFNFTHHRVEIAGIARGTEYYSFRGFFHNLGPDGEVFQDMGPGLLTLDGIMVQRRAQFVPYGESTTIEEVEQGYFLGQISPVQTPDSPLAKALALGA